MENLAGGINFLRLRIGARRCLKLAVVPKHEAERKWCRRKPAVLHPSRRIPSVRRFSRGPVFGARVHLARGGSGIVRGRRGEFEIRRRDATEYSDVIPAASTCIVHAAPRVEKKKSR